MYFELFGPAEYKITVNVFEKQANRYTSCHFITLVNYRSVIIETAIQHAAHIFQNNVAEYNRQNM